MLKVKVTQVGNSVGIILPKETLRKLNTSKGDTLFLVETKDGYTLTPFDQEFEEQIDIATTMLKKYRNAFRELAK